MQIKKSPKADLQNKRGLLLEIGLAVSLLLIIAAFAYTPKEYRIEQVDNNTAIAEEVIVEITRQDQKPPVQPKKVEVKMLSDLLKVVDNNTKIETEINFDEFDEDTEIITDFGPVEEEIVDDQPFLTAETMPSFQGGDLNKFRTWVQSTVNFPQIALENGIQGRVTVSFVIERDGRLTNIEVIQSPDRSLSEETIRALNKSPKWSPGKQRNQPVRVKYTLPVDFRMQQ